MWHAISKEVYKYLDSLKVMWSSIDPVCFSEEGGKASPLYLWIGINLGTLSFQVAKAAAASCKMILASANFPHIEIAFRESIITWSSPQNPQLLSHPPPPPIDPLADIFSPFTGTLGVPIAPQNTSYLEGTSGLYRCNSHSA